jgi:hypothetical protein
MTKVKNITDDTLGHQGLTFAPAEVRDVPDAQAAAMTESNPNKFRIVVPNVETKHPEPEPRRQGPLRRKR